MDISRIEHGSKGAFIIKEGNQQLAEMTYSKAGDSLIIIDHTDVDDRLRGKGAGKKLVQTAVDWARAESKQLMPLCPFARSVFDKTPEYSDVLAK